ncbi:MAG: hypothetical protein MUP16_07310 [Sedimentisphaerales bacterium]|nr:hypothetical protein [Sedimentisphaerales bacterium]
MTQLSRWIKKPSAFFLLKGKKMAGQKTINATYFPPVELPVVLTVTGTPTPDCRGNYLLNPLHNGKASYKREDGLFYIWYDSGELYWVISAELGSEVGDYWDNDSIHVEGEYQMSDEEGNLATVTLL